MHRLLGLVAVLAVLTGCAGGPDGDLALDVLKRADAKHATLSSMAYTARMTMSFEGQRLELGMEGAAELKGEDAGDQWLRMTMPDVPDVPALGDLTMVVRDGVMTMHMFGETERVPLPAGAGANEEALASFAALELARCVETVRVTENSSLDGEPATRISGVVDTECVIELVGTLSKLGGAAGQDVDLADLGAEIGDVRATLYVSNRSQLLLGGVFSLEVAMDGEEVSVDVVYRLKSVNEPVRFPEL